MLTIAEYIAHVSYMRRFLKENIRIVNSRNARAISVGIPLDVEANMDRQTLSANGMAIPEADREVNKSKLVLLK